MPSAGDMAIALPSSGVHANGFSLVRKIIEVSKTDLAAPVDGMAEPLGATLMQPTRIYHRAAQTARMAGCVTGICHVTGGGLVENPPRVYGDEIALELDCSSWSLPPLFEWLAKAGNIAPLELARTFNCGIGMLLFVDEVHAEECLAALRQGPEPDAWIAGRLVEREQGAASVSFSGLDAWPSPS